MSIEEKRARPLRKRKPDGTLYQRRSHVEAELETLLGLPLHKVQSRVQLPKTEPDFVSSEALVHLVRIATPGSRDQNSLILVLLERLHRRLPKPTSADGETVSHSRTLVRDHVRDAFVDLLLTDLDAYDERLDFYEASFDRAVAWDRLDAERQAWAKENRSEELGTEDDEGGVSPEVEAAIGADDPFDADRMDEKAYRLRLEAAIDALPSLQQVIVHMLLNDMPIRSDDPNALTISKSLDKAEKTIRSHRDKAFAFLRIRLTRLKP